MTYSFLFGPVSSRRLGRSLGVDMIPFKTCNCNCVYCECGTANTVGHGRKTYIPAEGIISELDDFLSARPVLDYVTFAGSGEPTLNLSLGRVIQFVKESYPSYKTALLTNGLLLSQSDVRNEILPIDLVLPSLDAVSDDVFNQINRPFPGITVQQMVDGLYAFSRIYKGLIWVEVFIVPGINDTPKELELLKSTLIRLNPARVQLNSLDRPAACTWVTTASPDNLASIAAYLQPLPVEIISRTASSAFSSTIPSPTIDTAINNQLRRRPATVEEIAVFCGVTINEAKTMMKSMIEEKRAVVATVDNRQYYSISENTK